MEQDTSSDEKLALKRGRYWVTHAKETEDIIGPLLRDSIRAKTTNWESEPSTTGNILANIRFNYTLRTRMPKKGIVSQDFIVLLQPADKCLGVNCTFAMKNVFKEWKF